MLTRINVTSVAPLEKS